MRSAHSGGMSAKSINFDYTTDAVGGSGAERQRGADWTVASQFHHNLVCQPRESSSAD